MVATKKMTPLQIELVKTFAWPVPESQVLEIKALLSQYFLDKMDTEMDKLCTENNWTQSTFDDWANDHSRTSLQ